MVKFETVLDEQTSKQLNKHGMKKFGGIMAILSVVFILIGVLSLVFQEDSTDYFLGIFLIVFGILYAPIVWVITRFVQRGRDKTSHYLGAQESYEFYDDYVIITQQKGEQLKVTMQAAYSYFYCVKETPTHYYFYISRVQCHVVPKSSLVEGTLDELTDILTHALPTTYKR